MTDFPTRRAHRTEPTEEDIKRLKAEHAEEIDRRCELTGRSIYRFFGQRALGMPGTLIGAPQFPDIRGLSSRLANWHFWWQAHLLDCAVDASYRAYSNDDAQTALSWFSTAQQVLRGIRTRNLGSVTNSYYDDMAWLTLAAGRLNSLSIELNGIGDRAAQEAGSSLYATLTKGATSELGGGMFWSTKKDFKNTPATAPTALAFVRGHRVEQAASLLNWLNAKLWDDERQLYLDGIHLREDGTEVAEGLFTYNQGPVLSAMLEVAQAGGHLNFDVPQRIGAVLSGIERQFVIDFELSSYESLRVLKTQGSGDAGLFTGILARYLAQVALDPTLPADLRERAGDLVVHTAELLWEGRREFDPDLPLNEAGIDVTEIRGEAIVLFSTDIERHSSETLRPGAPVELSPQLQAWIVMEAAARVLAD